MERFNPVDQLAPTAPPSDGRAAGKESRLPIQIAVPVLRL